jgi:putative ABC transport system substrate-binding protein
MRRRELMLMLGGALAVPHTLRAQQKAMPVIGWLHSLSPDRSAAVVAAFGEGLREAGYVAGKNVAIEYRWAEGDYDRLPALAADLVGRKVDVIVTGAGTVSAVAAKKPRRRSRSSLRSSAIRSATASLPAWLDQAVTLRASVLSVSS